MKLPGTISRVFRSYQECDLCGTISRWKAKCWDEEDLSDVYYACKKCHDNFSCCGCSRPRDSFVLGIWNKMSTTKGEESHEE